MTKIANTADDISETIKLISPYDLMPTHKPTMSKKQYAGLVNDIQRNGITETIKYVEYNGTKYVVDGHHRLQVAKDLKLKYPH